MRIDWRVWIPLIGIYFGAKNVWIALYDGWLEYQFMCLLISVLAYFTFFF